MFSGRNDAGALFRSHLLTGALHVKLTQPSMALGIGNEIYTNNAGSCVETVVLSGSPRLAMSRLTLSLVKNFSEDTSISTEHAESKRSGSVGSHSQEATVARSHDSHHEDEEQLSQHHQFPASLPHAKLRSAFTHSFTNFRDSGLDSRRESGDASVGHRMSQGHCPLVIPRDIPQSQALFAQFE